MDWNDTTHAQLRALWDEGHSASEIGRRLGCTKNAVVGKAHRLDLSERPDPIIRDPNHVSKYSPKTHRIAGPTLPPLPSGIAPPPPATPRPVLLTHSLTRYVPPSPRFAPTPHAVAPIRKREGRVIACCWPIGEPGTRGFRFCEAPSDPGRPYCEPHVGIAYVRVSHREAVAAE